MIQKPMLSATAEDLNDLQFPYLASPKLDGIRATIQNGVVYSRSLKPIPNHYVQKLFAKPEYEGFDGELIVGEPNSHDAYRSTSSGVMSHDGEPDVTLYAFDLLGEPEKFITRLGLVKTRLTTDGPVKLWDHTILRSVEQLVKYEHDALQDGYEGVMLRDPYGTYKNGRSTLRENGLIKLKKFLDGEAVIIGYDELLINDNPPTINKLGKQERSSHKANMRPGNTLGNLLVRGLPDSLHYANTEFSIGSGFTDEIRQTFWDNRRDLMGKIVTYKHFPIGVKDKPRHPVFLRMKMDDF